MKKTKRIEVRLTEEQHKILEARAINSGYNKKSDYIRSIIFLKKPLQEQLEELIHEIKNQSLQNNKHQR